MSNSIMTAYEKKVAATLDETGHSLRKDVMSDLRNHLRETFAREDAPQSMDELVERLGSPEEYAESLAPAGGYRMKPLVQRRVFWMGASIGAAVILVTIVITINRHSIAAHYRQAIGKNYRSTPFFDLDRMRSLKAGASADEIRDAIGYPFRRIQWQGPEGKPEKDLYWEYTAIPSRYAPFYTNAQLVTDMDQMKLIRMEINNVGIGNPPDERIIRHPVGMKVGSISFSRAGGERLILKPSSDLLYVIATGMGVRSPDDLAAKAIEKREAFITAGWKNVPRERIRFIHIVGPRGKIGWPKLNDLLRNLPSDSPIYSTMGMPHVFENRGAPVESLVYDVMVYSKGMLYQYPPIYGSTPKIEETYRDDQNWLMHRLLESN